jgi:hypothetical protein
LDFTLAKKSKEKSVYPDLKEAEVGRLIRGGDFDKFVTGLSLCLIDERE